MKKFVFIYYGGRDSDEVTKEEREEIMSKWKAWFGSFADKMVDGGNPFNREGMAVMTKETIKIAADMWPAKGYTIINAADMAEATKIAKGCPMIVTDEKNATVRVYEAMPM